MSKFNTDRHRVSVVQKALESIKNELVHSVYWKASEDDRESGVIYAVHFAIVEDDTAIVFVNGYSHSKVFVGHIEDAIEAFNSEMQDGSSPNNVDEATFSEEYELVSN